MRQLTILALFFAACTGTEVTLTGADAENAPPLTPPPPLFFVALLPDDATATELANTPTATMLPTLPIVLGGQASLMVVPRVAARTPWAGHIELKLWLERDDAGYPAAPPVYASVALEPLGPLWVTPELPLVLDAPCALVDHTVHARGSVVGLGAGQNLDGRFHVSWTGSCP